MMARVAETADRVVAETASSHQESRIDTSTFSDSICDGANRIAQSSSARTSSSPSRRRGAPRFFMSRYRPKIPVVAVTDDLRTVRRMAIYRGVEPILVTSVERSEELVFATEQEIMKRELARWATSPSWSEAQNLSTRGNVNSLDPPRRRRQRGLKRARTSDESERTAERQTRCRGSPEVAARGQGIAPWRPEQFLR